MTTKQTNHVVIQKVCHLNNGIFHSINLCHTLPISSPLCYSLTVTNYGMREKEIFCIYGCFSTLCYINGGRISHL